MNNSSYFSNGSSEYEANSDTLDQLFKEQLRTLRELILKQNQANEIDLCQKWLKVFSKTSKAEKIARNCLCSLMQQQLQDGGFLSAPFTDLQNCNRDLECVLRELDNESYITELTETVETYTSHCKQQLREPKSENANDSIDSYTECMDNETQAENVLLRRELESIRLHLTEKQIENAKLKEIVEKFDLENCKYMTTFDNFKQTFLDAIKKSLHELEDNEECFPFKIFTKVFNEFSSDEEFFNSVKNYDTIFEVILNKKFAMQFNKRKSMIAQEASQKFKKTKTKLREKYDQRLRVQSWAQRLQLKLVKLKCFSVLRNIFITSQNGNKETMWEILKVLEEKYQNIVNEIL